MKTLKVLEHSDVLLFSAFPKLRPSLGPVVVFEEPFDDDEDDVLVKFGGILVPKISKLLLMLIL
jgi:hypothetical protein